MKVITQLIRHFWQRGALTPLEVAYLRCHGFCREKDVPGFKTPRAGAEAPFEDFELQPVQMPDGLEVVQESLIRRSRGRGVGFKAKLKALTDKELRRRLNREFEQRESDLQSLLALGRQFAEVKAWDDAASRLHAITSERFHRGLCGGLRDESVRIGDLWQASDPAPFHRLMDADDFRGRTARAFQAVFFASGPAELGTSRGF